MEIWTKIFECEHGLVHIDVNADDRTNLQLVIRGHRLLGRLYNTKMIWLKYDQKEFLLRGYHSELKQETPTATFPKMLPGIFYPWDFYKFFHEEMFGSNGRVIELERRGNDLVFKNGYRQAGNSKTYYYHNYKYTHHQTYYFDREYVLKGGI